MDVPLLPIRLHYSFIWDKVNLYGLEDIDLKAEVARGKADQLAEKMEKLRSS